MQRPGEKKKSVGQPRVASRLVSLDLEESRWKLCVKGGRETEMRLEW